MAERYLEPAYSVIMKFSHDGKLSSGIKAVCEITGRTESGVFRWMRPRLVGGTDGWIPSKHQTKLLQHAKPKLKAEDFFGQRTAA